MEWIKSNRAELLLQAQKFSNGIASVGSTVGLSNPEITGFAATLLVYTDELATVVSAKAAFDLAYEAFMTDKAAMVKLMRKYNRRMQASAGITNSKRAEIGIPIPAGSSTPVEPKTVTGLIAQPFANGEVKLKWSRSGNNSLVVFNIMRSDDAVNWELAAAVTRTSLMLNGYTPGETKYFRIVATRGTLHAVPSENVVIYSGSGGGELSIAA